MIVGIAVGLSGRVLTNVVVWNIIMPQVLKVDFRNDYFHK